MKEWKSEGKEAFDPKLNILISYSVRQSHFSKKEGQSYHSKSQNECERDHCCGEELHFFLILSERVK